MLELSNYWDDFQQRVNYTIDSLKSEQFPKLERLTVHLTESCNFRCEYCNMRFSTKTMNKKLAFKIVDDYVSMGGNIIHFTGGEPSVVSYVEELFLYAKSKGLVVSSNTNGYRKMNTENIDKLKTSFDTPFENVFNETMGTTSFKTVVENMKSYSKEMKNKMLSITAVLNRKTYKNMLSLAKFVQENFKVYNLYYSNYKGNNPDFAFTDEEIYDMFKNHIPQVLQYFLEKGNIYSYKQLSLYSKEDFKNTACRFEVNKKIPCYIQLSELTIDVDGNCHNCSHLFRDGVEPKIRANVSKNSLLTCFIEMKKEFKDINNAVFISEKCLNGCNKNLIGFNLAVENKKYI